MTQKNTFYMESLTSIRGLMASWVVIFHIYQYYPMLKSFIDGITPIISRGYLAVDFFFMLSGFILTHVYSKNQEMLISKKDYIDFMVARFARVYPLHFVILFIFVFFDFARLIHGLMQGNIHGTPPFTDTHQPIDIIWNLLLIQNWFNPSQLTWNGPAWSLSLEWFSYWLFPFIGYYFKKFNLFALMIAVLALCQVNWLVMFFTNTNSVAEHYSILRCLPEFMIGIGLYYLYTRAQVMFISSDCFLGMTCFATISMIHFHVPDPLIILSLAINLYTLAHNKGFFSRLLSTKSLHYIGEVSFSVYLTHILLMQFWNIIICKIFGESWPSSAGIGPSAISLLCFLVILLLISHLSYLYIEKNSRLLIRDLYKKHFTLESQTKVTPAY